MSGYQGYHQGQLPGGYDEGRAWAPRNPTEGWYSETETDPPEASMATSSPMSRVMSGGGGTFKRPAEYSGEDIPGVADAKRSRLETGGVPVQGQGQDVDWGCGTIDVADRSRTLFIFNLMLKTTTSELFKYFVKFGDLMKFHVFSDNEGKSTGAGIVQFVHEGAAMAVLAARPHFIHKKQIVISEDQHSDPKKNANVKWSLEKHKLYVSDIPVDVAEEDLCEYFSQWGNITICDVAENAKRTRNAKFAFVSFSNYEDAVKCLNTTHSYGNVVMNVQVAARCKSLKNAQKALKNNADSGRNQQTDQLFVSNIPDEVTKDELMKHFSMWGGLILCKIQGKVKQNNNFGFVCFQKQEDALTALIMPHTLRHSRVFVRVAKKTGHLLEASKDPKIASTIEEKVKNCYLFVPNLDVRTNRDELYEHFKKYGSLASCMFRPCGKNQIVAYITYVKEDDAQRCYNDVHFFDDKELNVRWSELTNWATDDPKDSSSQNSDAQAAKVPRQEQRTRFPGYERNASPPRHVRPENPPRHAGPVSPPRLARHASPPRPAGPARDVGPGRFTGATREVDPPRPAGPTRDVGIGRSTDATGDVDPPRPAGPTRDVGLGRSTGATREVDPPRPAGPARDGGLGTSTGATKDVDPPRPVGPTRDVGLGRSTGTTREVDPPRPAGPARDVGPSRFTGATRDVDPPRPAGPTRDVGLGRSTGATRDVGPPRPAGPTRDVGLGRPAGRTRDGALARPAYPVTKIGDPPNQKLRISGLAANTSGYELMCYFSRWGRVEDFELAKDETSRPTGCAFVIFEKLGDAEKAVLEKPHVISNKKVEVTYANPHKDQRFPSWREQTAKQQRFPKSIKSRDQGHDPLEAREPRRSLKDTQPRRSLEDTQQGRSPKDTQPRRSLEDTQPRRLTEAYQPRRQSTSEPLISGFTQEDCVPDMPLATEYECNVPGCSFKGKSERFGRHWTKIHEAKGLYLICSFCTMGCVDADDLREHLDFFHGVEDRNEMKTFLRGAKQQERDNIHFIMPGSVTRETCMKVKESPQKSDAKDVYNCTECTFAGTVDEFLDHWDKHHLSRLSHLKCPKCPKTFMKKDFFLLHIKNQHGTTEEPEDVQDNFEDSQNFNFGKSQHERAYHELQGEELPRSEIDIPTISGTGSRSAGNLSLHNMPRSSFISPLQFNQNVLKPQLPVLSAPPVTHSVITPSEDPSSISEFDAQDLIDYDTGNIKPQEKENIQEKSPVSQSEPEMVTQKDTNDELKRSVQSGSVLALRPEWTKTMKVAHPKKSSLGKNASVKKSSFTTQEKFIPKFDRTHSDTVKKFLLWSHIMMKRLEDANMKVRRRLKADEAKGDVAEADDDDGDPEEMLELSPDNETVGGNVRTAVKGTLSQAHEDMKARAPSKGRRDNSDRSREDYQHKTDNRVQASEDLQQRTGNRDRSKKERQERTNNGDRSREDDQHKTDNRVQASEDLQQRTGNRDRSKKERQERTDNSDRSREDDQHKTDNRVQASEGLQQRTGNRDRSRKERQQRTDNGDRSREDDQHKTDNRVQASEDLQQRTGNGDRSKKERQERTDNSDRSREDDQHKTDNRVQASEGLQQRTGNGDRSRKERQERTDNSDRSREDDQHKTDNRVQASEGLQQRTGNGDRSRKERQERTDNSDRSREDDQHKTDNRVQASEGLQQRTGNGDRSRKERQQRTSNVKKDELVEVYMDEYVNENEEYALAYVDEDGVHVMDDNFVMGEGGHVEREERMDKETGNMYPGMDTRGYKGKARSGEESEGFVHAERVVEVVNYNDEHEGAFDTTLSERAQEDGRILPGQESRLGRESRRLDRDRGFSNQRDDFKRDTSVTRRSPGRGSRAHSKRSSADESVRRRSKERNRGRDFPKHTEHFRKDDSMKRDRKDFVYSSTSKFQKMHGKQFDKRDYPRNRSLGDKASSSKTKRQDLKKEGVDTKSKNQMASSNKKENKGGDKTEGNEVNMLEWELDDIGEGDLSGDGSLCEFDTDDIDMGDFIVMDAV